MKPKNRINVTEKNINFFSPYQGNDQQLKVGDILSIEKPCVACVIHIKGHSKTFSIYTGKILKRYVDFGIDQLQAYTFMHNRFSINDKFTK
jgi:hypothetical protein